MGKPPSGTDNVKHPTDLQRRLAAEVKAGCERTGKKPADLARETGIKPPYVTQMLNFSRQGTIASWDLLLRAVGVAGWLVPKPVGLPVVEHVDQVESITLTDQKTGKTVSYPAAPSLPPSDPPAGITGGGGAGGMSGWPGVTIGHGGGGGGANPAPSHPTPVRFDVGGGAARGIPQPWPGSRPKPPPEPDVSSDEDFAPRTKR